MKTPMILAAAAALSVGVQGNTLAQTPTPGRPDSSCTKYSDGRIECRRILGRLPGDSLRRFLLRGDSTMIKRAALGVELRPTGTRRDTLGVFVAAVTARGPAETAGIIEGDRIAAINGVDVRSVAADIEDPYTNRLASHRLTREIHRLTPGARVTLRIYSGGRYRDVVVTTGRASDVLRQANRFNIRVPGSGARFELFSPEGEMLRGVPFGFERLPMIRERIERLAPRALELRRTKPTRIRRAGEIQV